jgi:tetratricopeptide (TPR) repeat protein
MKNILFLCLSAILCSPIPVLAQGKSTSGNTGAKSTPSDSQASASSNPSAPTFKTYKDAHAAGNEAMKNIKYDEAAADYAAAEDLATSPKIKSQMANSQGWALLKGRKLAEAKKAFTHAVEENPDNKLALQNLGAVEYNLYEYGMGTVDDLKDAVKNLETSGENQEDLDRAKAALDREGSYAKATPEAVSDLSGMNFKALCALSDKLQEEGQFDQAMKVLKKAADIAVSPATKAAAANRRGKLLLDNHKPAESVPYFEEAVKDKSDEKTYLNNLGWANWTLYQSGKGGAPELKTAVEAFYKMNSIDPSYHSESLKTALEELKEVDPEAAKAYTVKDETTTESDKTANPKNENTKDETPGNNP